MMNRSFILVAVLGLCSVSFAAPAASLSGSIDTIPLTTAAVVPSVSATSSFFATATPAATSTAAPVPNVNAAAPVVVHGGAPETNTIIEGLRGGAGGVFRRAASSSDVIDALRASGSSSGTFARDTVEVRYPHGNIGAGAPFIPGNTFSSNSFHSRQDAVISPEALKAKAIPRGAIDGAVESAADSADGSNLAQRQVLSGACSRWNAQNCRRQAASPKGIDLPDGPSPDALIDELRDGVTIFRRSPEIPHDGTHQLLSSVSDKNLNGAPRVEPLLERLRQGTVFKRSEADNFPGASEFPPLLDGLRQGGVFFRAYEDSEEGHIERRDSSVYVSPSSDAPDGTTGGSFSARHDQVESRNFGGQAIPMENSNPDLLKALWGTPQQG